jgi:thiol-disulfide isomerase/thioredoxin
VRGEFKRQYEKNNQMKRISLLVLFLGLIDQTFCQSKNVKPIYPEVGKPMTNFVLNDVQYFPKKKVTLNDFNGKWLILDWWTQYCTRCIESFPKVDALQKEFKDKVQFLLIGYTGTEVVGSYTSGDKVVRSIYERSRRSLNLTVPIAYDSLLYQKFNLGTTPYQVIIDPNGIVRAIGVEVNSEKLQNLIDGKPTTLERAFRRDQTNNRSDINTSLPFLTYDNGGPDTSFLYRSLLARWKPENGYPNMWQPTNGRIEMIGSSLENLFFQAYVGRHPASIVYTDSMYGRLYPRIELDLKDSSLFKRENSGLDQYCFSLVVPGKNITNEFFSEVLKKELQNYFGYDARFETKKASYWRLVATDEAKVKLLSKSKEVVFKQNGYEGFAAQNIPVKRLIGMLGSFNQLSPPFIDETGIQGNIDITIDALLADFKDFKRALNENGLDLVKGEKEMKVLVIRDSKK